MTKGARRVGTGVAACAAVLSLAATAFAPEAASQPKRDASGRSSRTVAAHRQWGSAEEQGFIDRINRLRTSLGLAPLAPDAELTAQARVWSQTMKDAGNIFHTSNLAGGISADWEKLGENVGVGGTVDALFDAFVASPKHYENLVDPSYRFVGVGVVWDGTRMFTAHRFMALQPPAPPTTVPAQARVAPVATGADGTGTAPETPTTVPEELAATDTPPPTPATAAPPASPAQVTLVLGVLSDLLA